MKSLIALTLAACAVAPAFAQVGVSVSVGQPGVYGRIDIGSAPPPSAAFYSPQPVIVQPGPVAVYQRPIYMYVPPAYQSNWGRYCGRYNACGQPVYFVREDWARQHYYRPGPPPRPMGPPGHRHGGPPPGWRGDHSGPGHHGDDRGGPRGDRGDRGDHGGGHGNHRDGR